jgi:hypothetical protein
MAAVSASNAATPISRTRNAIKAVSKTEKMLIAQLRELEAMCGWGQQHIRQYKRAAPNPVYVWPDPASML